MSLLFILDEQNNSSQISEPHNFWKKMHTAIPVCYFVRKKVPVWFDERQEVPVWHTVSYRPTSSTEFNSDYIAYSQTLRCNFIYLFYLKRLNIQQ